MLIVYRAKAFHLSCRFNRLACRSEKAACCFLADAVIAFLGIHFQTLLIRRLTSGVHDKCRGQVGNNLVRKNKYFRKQLTSPQKANGWAGAGSSAAPLNYEMKGVCCPRGGEEIALINCSGTNRAKSCLKCSMLE